MRIYLAAPSQLYSNPAIRLKSHRLLTSFIGATWTAERLEKALTAASPTEGYCVDSGAHVWLSSYFKKQEVPPIAAVEKHLYSFLAQVQRLQKKPTFVVELDLQRIYGMSVVEVWRRDLWGPLEDKTGIRVCYVWQPTDGDAKWEAMLRNDRMRYLGMGGGTYTALTTPMRASMSYRAYDAAKPVHGFAAVRGRWLKEVPFFSVDSTSWAAGTFFGLIPSFDSMTGKLSQRAVGYKTFASDPKAVLARLVRAKSSIPITDLTERSNGKNFSAFFQQAATAYLQFESWHTAWWRAKGLDWEGRLAAAGNLPPG